MLFFSKFLCVIYLLVGSQKIVFRDIPSVSDDRFPIMRKMMNTNTPPTNDPMKGLGDITISSPMKDVVQDKKAEKSEEKKQKSEDESEILEAEHLTSDDHVDLTATEETILDIFATAKNFSLGKNYSSQENIPLLLHVDTQTCLEFKTQSRTFSKPPITRPGNRHQDRMSQPMIRSILTCFMVSGVFQTLQSPKSLPKRLNTIMIITRAGNTIQTIIGRII